MMKELILYIARSLVDNPEEVQVDEIVRGQDLVLQLRVAKGAGVGMGDVNLLLKQFEQMRRMMQSMTGGKPAKMPKMPMMPQMRGRLPGLSGLPGMPDMPGMNGMMTVRGASATKKKRDIKKERAKRKNKKKR